MNQRLLWWQALGVLVIVVGVLLLLAVLGIIGSLGQVVGIIFGAVLIIMGLYVLLRFRPTGGVAKDALVGSMRRFGPGWSLQSDSYQVGVGEIRLDLTQAHILEGEYRLALECFIGSISVVVPRIVALNARGHASLGSVAILGQKAEGIGRTLSVRSPDYGASTRRLVVDAEVALGEVKIEYGAWKEEE